MSRVFHVTVGDRASGGDRRRAGIVAGYLAPHPPHLIYAENPPQNEPRSRGGWEVLRWAYQEARRRLRERHRPDVIVVHAPHWITMVGHHVNCVPNPRGLSVEPIFPHLLRYRYDFRTDVELATAIADCAADAGLVTRKMTNPGVRVDYATIGALHLLNPDWDIPVVSLSANNNPYFYADADLEQMERLGAATRRAVEETGRRAVLAASNSLSHLHWDREPELPEDMAAEHPYDDHQYRWDMDLLTLVRAGRTRSCGRSCPATSRPPRPRSRRAACRGCCRPSAGRRSPGTCSATAPSSAPGTRWSSGTRPARPGPIPPRPAGPPAPTTPPGPGR